MCMFDLHVFGKVTHDFHLSIPIVDKCSGVAQVKTSMSSSACSARLTVTGHKSKG